MNQKQKCRKNFQFQKCLQDFEYLNFCRYFDLCEVRALLLCKPVSSLFVNLSFYDVCVCVYIYTYKY